MILLVTKQPSFSNMTGSIIKFPPIQQRCIYNVLITIATLSTLELVSIQIVSCTMFSTFLFTKREIFSLICHSIPTSYEHCEILLVWFYQIFCMFYILALDIMNHLFLHPVSLWQQQSPLLRPGSVIKSRWPIQFVTFYNYT